MTRLLRINLALALGGLVVSGVSLYFTSKIVQLGGERYAWELDIAKVFTWWNCVVGLGSFWRIRDIKRRD